MKILLLDHGRTLGGGQVMARRLLPQSRARGFDIDALVGCAEVPGGAIPTSFAGLRRAMRGYDLVYANTARTAIAAATTRRPFVWHKHLPESTWVQGLAARRARRVISICRFGAPQGSNVRVIYNGVPSMNVEEDAENPALLPEGRRILLLGRYHREKGHDLAVQALDRMQQKATLVAAGPGSWTLPPHPRVAVLGLRHDVAALLRASDVLLNASRFNEGCPLVVLEAMRAGLPIVAASVGGIPEIVEEGKTAFLVPKEDVGAMARALDRALLVDRAAWAREAELASRRFTIEACADAIAVVLREALEAR